MNVRGLAGLILLGSLALLAVAKEKEPSGDLVDSGSFGVFVNGRRMATESFSIHQQKGGNSTTSSQFKEEGSSNPSQRCDMQITPGGALVRYEWRELSPGKSRTRNYP